MRFRLSRLLAAGVAAALTAGLVTTPVASGAIATDVLTFDRLPGLDRAASQPAPHSQQMVVAVGLQNPSIPAEDAFYRRLYDPRDPMYLQFLTPAEVGRRFGVPASQRAAARAMLGHAGLHITQESTEGDWYAAEGTVSRIQSAFNVHIRQFSAQGRQFLANLEGPTVRRAAHVLTVIGLNTWQRWAIPSRPKQDSCLGTACIGLLTPDDLWSIYDEPARYRGQGQSMAIIGEGDPSDAIDSLAAFDAHYDLPHTKLHVVCVQHRNCGSDTSGDGEWRIDTQSSTGMAPLAQETLYFAQGLEDPKIDTAFLAWINDPKGPRQASASEGVCEQTPLNDVFRGPLESVNGNDNYSLPLSLAIGDDQEPVIDQALRHAAIEGRTLFSSTGDNGFTCGYVLLPFGLASANGLIYDGIPQVSYPNSSRFATAVGGTVIYSDGGTPAHRVLEYAWTYGGGGSSYFQPAPAFQQRQSHVIGRCISSPNSFTSGNGPSCRGVPDVAALSGDVTTGYTIYNPDGSFGGGGGTSLSSPLWLGMWTRVQQAAAAAGAKRGLGFADETLYALGNDPATFARDFNDITIGFNGYPALPGWDYTTGFGSPHLTALIADALAHARLRPR